jgi:hypothetical protein
VIFASDSCHLTARALFTIFLRLSPEACRPRDAGSRRHPVPDQRAPALAAAATPIDLKAWAI